MLEPRWGLIAAGLFSTTLLGGCWIFMPETTQQGSAGQAPAAAYDPAQEYIKLWEMSQSEYDAAPEGDDARVNLLFDLHGIYADIRIAHPDL